MFFSLMGLCVFFSMLFFMGSHPLFMGLVLFVEVFLISLMIGLYSHFFFYSYLLFLVFLGGVLVLFMYIVSLVSNEFFIYSSRGFFMSVVVSCGFLLCIGVDNWGLLEGVEDYSCLGYVCMFSLLKLYYYPSCYVTLFLSLYLLLVLLVVVRMVDVGGGPLRSGVY